LKRHPRFALWRADDNRWYAGFIEASGSAPSSLDFGELPLEHKTSNDELPLAQLLTSIFENTKTPLEFDQLVTLVADKMGIADAPPQPLESIQQDAGRATENARVDIR